MGLSQRGRSVLYAVVNEFIATGEPVGSRTLAKKYGFDLSPATIRNVLADLEDEGYLVQPHTSAGRVPTEPAFRLFIDALMRVRQLTTEEAGRIRDLFGEVKPGHGLLREAGRLLSDLTGGAAVLVRSSVETRTLVKLQFIPTRPNELLGVAVLSDGTVENRFIELEEPLASRDLERLHNLLSEAVEGKTLAEIRDHFAHQIADNKDELQTLHQVGYSLVTAAIEGADRRLDVVIEGQARLLDSAALKDAARVKELFAALEAKEQMVSLLDRIMATSRVQVFLGEETAQEMGFPLSLVAAPYSLGERPAGALGVLGTTRMDYPGVVPLVGATANAMSAALSPPSRSPLPEDDDGEEGHHTSS